MLKKRSFIILLSVILVTLLSATVTANTVPVETAQNDDDIITRNAAAVSESMTVTNEAEYLEAIENQNINNVILGSDIVLTNASQDSYWDVTNDKTLDLNGYMLDLGTNYINAYFYGESILTIKDSSEEKTGLIYTESSTPKFIRGKSDETMGNKAFKIVVENGNFISVYDSEESCLIDVESNNNLQELVIEDATFEGGWQVLNVSSFDNVIIKRIIAKPYNDDGIMYLYNNNTIEVKDIIDENSGVVIYYDNGETERYVMGTEKLEYIYAETTSSWIEVKSFEKITKNFEIVGTYEYTGQEQEVQVMGYNPETMIILGNKQTDAGVYKIEIALKEGFVWEDGTITPVELEWEITKKKITLDILIENCSYGQGLNFQIIGNSINAIEKIEFRKINEDVYTEELPAEVGKYEIRCTIDATPNCTGGVATKEFEIIKAKVEKPILEGETEFFYDGEEKSINIIGYDSQFMNEEGQIAAIGCGKYTYEISLKDTNNYEWADGTIDELIFDWEIIVSENIEVVGEYVYTGEEQEVILNGYDETIMKIVGNRQTNVGRYKIIITLQEGKTWNDGTTTPLELEWEIQKKMLEPEIVITNSVYGEELNIEVNGNLGNAPEKIEFKNEREEVYTETIPTQAGKYEAKYTIEESDNYTEGAATTEFEIARKIVEKPTIDGLVEFLYDKEEKTLSVNGFNQEIMKELGTKTETEIGEYTYVISLKDYDNYIWSDATSDDLFFDWSIVAQGASKNLEIVGEYEYTGEEQTAEIEGYIEDLMNISGNKQTNAGTYTITITPKEGQTWEDGTTEPLELEWKIEKKALEPQIVTQGWMYSEEPNIEFIGNFGNASEKIEFKNLKDDTDEYTEGIPTQAGLYEARYTVEESDNYTAGSVTIEFTITKLKVIKPTIDGETELAYDRTEKTLNVVGFDSEFMNEYGTKTETEIGEYEYIVSLKDANNYEWADGTLEEVIVFNWSIVSQGISSNISIIGTYEYTGEEQTAEVSGYDETTMNITGNKQTNAGTHTITITLKEGQTWEDGTIVPIEVEWEIAKKILEPQFLIDAWTYGEEAVFEVIGNLGNAPEKIEFKNADDDDDAYTETIPTQAGLYSIRCTIDETENYSDAVIIAEFRIFKVQLVKPFVDGALEFVYDSEEKMLNIVGFDSNLMIENGDKAATEIGEYEYSVSIKDIYNYEWLDGSNNELIFDWEILSEGFNTDIFIIGEYEYTGEEQVAEINGYDEKIMNISGNVQTNAGTYTITITPKEGQTWEDGSRTPLELEWKIAKKVIEPQIVINGWIFGGTPNIEVSGNEGNAPEKIEFKNVKEDEYTEEVPTQAGMYEARYEIEESDNHTSGNVTVEFEISRMNVEKPILDSESEFNYDGEEKGIVVTGYDSNTMIESGTKAATGIGEYTYTISLKDVNNYEWADGSLEDVVAFNWSIVNAGIDSNIIIEGTYEYTGEEQTAIISGYDEIAMNIAGNIQTNAGKYTITITLKEGYTWLDGTTETIELEWEIAKKIINPEIVIENWIYGEAPNIEVSGNEGNAPEKIEFKHVKEDEYTEREPINAGWYEAKYTIEETDNYIGGSVTVEFEISKAKVDKPIVTSEREFVYDGEEKELLVSGYDPNTMAENGTKVETEVGEYTFIILLKDNSNYEWSDGSLEDLVTFDWSIVGQNINSELKIVGTYEYTGEELTVEIEGYDKSIMDIMGNRQIDAGTHVVTIWPKEGHTWKDGTTTPIELEWKIERAKVEKPVLDGTNKLLYTGEAIEIIVSGFDANLMLESGDKIKTEIGDYEYIISLQNPNNYEWNDGTNGFIIFNWSIVEKVPLEIIGMYEYTGEEQTVEVSGYDETTMNITGNKQTNAGTYTVIVTPKEGQTWLDGTTTPIELEWKIEKKTLELEITVDECEFGEMLNVTVAGNVKNAPEKIEFKNVKEDDDAYTEEKPTNAGMYAVRYTVEETENYKSGSVTKEFEIAKAKLEKPTVEGEIEFVYDGEEKTLNVVGFDSNTMAENGTKTATDAGNYTYMILLKDNENYEWKDNPFEDFVEFNWSIVSEGIDTEISVVGTYEYTGEEQTAIVNGYDEKTMNIFGNKQTNAGTYTIIITPKEGQTWADGTTTPVELEWKIEKKTIVPEIIIENWGYGETPNIEVSGNEGNAPEKLEFKHIKEDEYTEEIPTQVGIYEVRYTIEETENYSGGTVTVEFEITRGKLEKPIVDGETEFTYDGEEKILNVVGIDSNIMTESATKKATNAGEYVYVVSLNDTDNYEWSDGTDLPIQISWKIQKAEVEKPILNGSNKFGYTGEEITLDISGFDSDTMIESGDKFATEIGYYEYTISLKDKNNYKWSDGTIRDLSFNWSIISDSVSSELSVTGIYEYTGEEQTVEISGYDETTMNITGNKQTNVGTYVVTITLKDGFTWEDGTRTPIELEWEIEKKALELELVVDECSYGEILNIEVSGNLGNASEKIEFKNVKEDDDAYTEKEPTTAGVYVVRYTVEETENYKNGSVIAEFEITKAKIDKPVVDGKTEFKYDGEEKTLNIIGYDSDTMLENGTKTATEVGEYTFMILLKDNENYEWSDGSLEDMVVFTWSIVNEGIDSDFSVIGTYEYTGEEQIAEVEGYDEAIMNISGNVQTNAGTYTITITPKEGHTWEDGTITPIELEWEIEKVIPAIRLNNLSQKVNNITDVTYIITPEVTDGIVTLEYKLNTADDSAYEETLPTKVGTYTVRLTLTDDTNLNDCEKIGTLKITKKSAGGGGGSSVTRYKITVIETEGGIISPETCRVEKGENKTFTIKADEGYELVDVLVDEESVGKVEKYTFENVNDKHTIEAVFKKIEKEDTDWENPFEDVDENDWYYEAIKYAYQNKLFNGVTENKFGPKVSMTRGMIVTVLYRLTGAKAETTEVSTFDDVDLTLYYSSPIAWATKVGIVNGVGENKFNPDAEVTREQLVTILYRYAIYMNLDVSVGEDTNILSYDDAFEVSEYAIEAFQWACGSGIITGRTESTLAPKGTASRAEVATMLMRFTN